MIRLFFLFPAFVFMVQFYELVYGQSPKWTIYNTSNSQLPDDQIKSINIDHTNNLWLGTAGGGLAKFGADGSWVSYNSSNSGLVDNYIDSVSIDKAGILWIATGSGILKFDPAAKKMDDIKAGWTIFSSSNSGLPNNDTYPIAIDADDNKWIGTFGFGVAKLSADGTWEVFNTSNSGLPDDFIRSIIIDDAQNKWIGTLYGGLAKMEPGKLGSSHANWTVFATYNSRLPNNAVWPLAIDEDDNLWIGTRGGGVAMFDPDLEGENENSRWKLFNTSNSGLPDNEVFSLACSNGKILWIGTANGGVVKFNTGENKWSVFNTLNSAVPCNEIRCIEIDKNGIVWFATYGGGLARYDENGKGWKGTLWDNLEAFDAGSPETWTLEQFKGLMMKFPILSPEHQNKFVSEFNNFLSANMQNVDALVMYARISRIKGIKGLMKMTEKTDRNKPGEHDLQIHAALDKALSINGNNAEAYYLKACLFSTDTAGFGMRRHDDFGSFSQALLYARKAVNLDAKNGEYRKLLALLLIEERNIEEAGTVMKEVNGGNDNLSLLINDFREFNLPPEAVFLKDETRAYAKTLLDTGSIPDYPTMRVHIYGVPYTVGDMEEFFKRWFNEFTFYPIGKDRKNAITFYRQFIKFLDQRHFVTGSKKDLPDAPVNGMDIAVQHFLRTPGVTPPPYVSKLIDANSLNKDLHEYCKIILVNYRK